MLLSPQFVDLLSTLLFSDGISAMKFKSLLFASASVSILAAGCSSDRISGLDRIPAQMNNVYGSYGYGRYSCPSGYSHDTTGWCKKNVSPKIEFPRIFPEVKLKKPDPRPKFSPPPKRVFDNEVLNAIEGMNPVAYSMLIVAVVSTFLAVTMSRKG